MLLKNNKIYSHEHTDLAMKVMAVIFVGDDYIRVKGMLFNKKNKIVYERKKYKLYKQLIKNWKIYEDL